jgi:hypothetical protein
MKPLVAFAWLVPLALGVTFPLALGIAFALGGTFPLALGIAFALGVPFPLGDTLSLALGVTFPLALGIAFALGVTLALGRARAFALTFALRFPLAAGFAFAGTHSVSLALRCTLALRVALALPVALVLGRAVAFARNLTFARRVAVRKSLAARHLPVAIRAAAARAFVDILVVAIARARLSVGRRFTLALIAPSRLRTPADVVRQVVRLDDGIEPLADRQAGAAGGILRGLVRVRAGAFEKPRTAGFHASVRIGSRGRSPCLEPARVNGRWRESAAFESPTDS